MDGLVKYKHLRNGPSKLNESQWSHNETPWGSYGERGRVTSTEAHLVYRTTKRLGEGNYADLGTFRGTIAWCMAWGLKESESMGTVYTVDTFKHQSIPNEYPNRMIEIFTKGGFDHYLNVCKGYTFDWAEKLKDIEFKFIFVDADHHYESVKNDFKCWSPLLAPKGEIAFHDTDMHGVDAFLRETMTPDKWEMVEHVYSTKLFRRRD